MKCDGWDQVEFGDLYSVPSKNGLTKPKSLRGNGVRFLNMGELFAYNRISDEPMDKAPITQREAMSYLLTKGDLLFARQSLVLSGTGKCSIIVDCKKDTTFDSHIIRIRLDQTKAFSLFYYYYFHSHYGRSQVLSTASQVAAAGIRGSDLAKIKVAYPPLPEQHAIASTLSCLDDKIELNNRMNKTLEEMAQAIFKSWFVNFEPFQDGEFVDSELGRIPKGWRVGTLRELCSYSQKRIDTNILTVDNYYSTENILPNKAGFVPASGIPKNIRTTACCLGDILISNIRPYFRKIVLCTQSGGCSADVLCFTPKEKEVSIFLYLLMCSEKFFSHIIAGSKGTKMPRGDKDQIMSYCIAIPTMGIIQAFDHIARPIIDEVKHNNESANKLSVTRDTLLPKLMSGEIRVPLEV